MLTSVHGLFVVIILHSLFKHFRIICAETLDVIESFIEFSFLHTLSYVVRDIGTRFVKLAGLFLPALHGAGERGRKRDHGANLTSIRGELGLLADTCLESCSHLFIEHRRVRVNHCFRGACSFSLTNAMIDEGGGAECELFRVTIICHTVEERDETVFLPKGISCHILELIFLLERSGSSHMFDSRVEQEI